MSSYLYHVIQKFTRFYILTFFQAFTGSILVEQVPFGEFHHKKQTLGYEKGYAVRALLPQSSSNVASQQSYPLTAFQSTSEQGDFAALSHNAKSKVPKWVEYDRKVYLIGRRPVWRL